MSGWTNDSSDRRQTRYESQPAGEVSRLPSELLESVLDNTSGGDGLPEPLDATTRAALLDLAWNSMRGQELSESSLVDLIRVLLRIEWPWLVKHPQWTAVAEEVARSIWEDPIARGQMIATWNLLQVDVR